MCRFWPLLCPTVSKRRAIAQKLEKNLSVVNLPELPSNIYNYLLRLDRAAQNNCYLETSFKKQFLTIEAVIFATFDIPFSCPYLDKLKQNETGKNKIFVA